MRVLFIHRHFPGPFRFIAQALGALPGSKILFLAERGRHELRLPKVRRLAIPHPSQPAQALAQALGQDLAQDIASPLSNTARQRETAELEMASILSHASATANTLLRLRQEGFVPDMVYSSPSGGYSLYTRDIFPKALHVAYANWFHVHDENFRFFHGDRQRSTVDFAPARIQNLLQYNALMESDLVITSTHWQRDHYPEALARNIHVCPEGVDSAFYTPSQTTPMGNDELVTYAVSEPASFAGVPQFMSALPKILETRPHCRVNILALSVAARQTADNALKTLPESVQNRVRLLLPADPAAVREQLQASTVHVYLTPPFTLTSLLTEALSCGCLVVGSDTAPVREIITHNRQGLLTNFWDSNALAATVITALENRHSEQTAAMRVAARTTILDNHDVRVCTERHLHLLFGAARKT